MAALLVSYLVLSCTLVGTLLLNPLRNENAFTYSLHRREGRAPVTSVCAEGWKQTRDSEGKTGTRHPVELSYRVRLVTASSAFYSR